MNASCPFERQVLEAAAEDLSTEKVTALKKHLQSCATCQQLHKEVEQARDELAQRFDTADFVSSVQAQVISNQKQGSTRLLRLAFLPAGLLLGLILMWTAYVDSPSPYGTKSASSASSDDQNKVGLRIYRVDSGQVSKLAGQMKSRDELLFAYSNLGPRPYAYLMIFAVDSKGEVYWFYPAYSKVGTDPKSLKILQNVTSIELPEKIRHDFEPGPIHICALFTRTPWLVSQIEQKVSAQLRNRPASDFKTIRFEIEDAKQILMKVQVD